MKPYYIESLSVKKLWGHRTYNLKFHDDVNVIIGPNASGKTTLINILHDALRVDVARLVRTEFTEVVIRLRSFLDRTRETLTIRRQDEVLEMTHGELSFRVEISPYLRYVGDDAPGELFREQYRLNPRSELDRQRLQFELNELVPTAWLPVSRRLPIADDEEIAQRRLHRKPLESVDERLYKLIEALQQYRLGLNSDLSEFRREFQRHALENILFDKQHDQLGAGLSFTTPSDEDKEQLLQAFRDVGLVDRKIEAKINEHFTAAQTAMRSMSSGTQRLDLDAYFIIPLISRTRAIVGFAQELQEKREGLFRALHEYETTVNSFLHGKRVAVSDRGDLIISQTAGKGDVLLWRHLSSGEKQILILLTQALLAEREPVVYVADEPELSLHVTWQEQLLPALTRLAGRCQFIVATHSPDVASRFGSRVIDLSRL
jgi:predicted ATPase